MLKGLDFEYKNSKRGCLFFSSVLLMRHKTSFVCLVFSIKLCIFNSSPAVLKVGRIGWAVQAKEALC